MPDIFQEDFRDFLKALNDNDVKYIMGKKDAGLLPGMTKDEYSILVTCYQ